MNVPCLSATLSSLPSVDSRARDWGSTADDGAEEAVSAVAPLVSFARAGALSGSVSAGDTGEGSLSETGAAAGTADIGFSVGGAGWAGVGAGFC